MSTNAVGTIVTDSDITEEIGEDEFGNLAPSANDGLSARQLTLNDILNQLKNRVPPINESSLVDLEQLRIPCVYGAVARLYRKSITTGDDVFAMKAKLYTKLYDDRVSELRPIVTGGRVAAPSSIRTFRQ